MKTILKKAITKILHPLILRLGYNADKVPEAILSQPDLLENFYRLLIKIKFVPNHIIDVGANHGNWTRSALKYFPHAFYTLLEPQHWLKNYILDVLQSNTRVMFHAVGAGSSPGLFKFTVAGRDDSSSFRFTPEEARNHELEQIEVTIVTLNEFIGKLDLPTPGIIKIDAEGLDLEVLKGADNYFGKTEVFIVEAGIGSRNIANSFLAVIKFMEANGYHLFEITDMNRPFDLPLLWLTELVFIKKEGFIDSQILDMNIKSLSEAAGAPH